MVIRWKSEMTGGKLTFLGVASEGFLFFFRLRNPIQQVSNTCAKNRYCALPTFANRGQGMQNTVRQGKKPMKI